MKYLVKVLVWTIGLMASTAMLLAQTATVAPSTVPKGAYVNGSDGDQQFIQVITYTVGANWASIAAVPDITITLPDSMTVANWNGDANYDDEVWMTELSAATAATVTASATQIFIDITAGVPLAAEIIYITFPVATKDSSTGSQDYAIALDVLTAEATLSFAPSVTYTDTITAFTFSTYYTGNDDATSNLGDVYPAAVQNLTTAAGDFNVMPDVAAALSGATNWFGGLAAPDATDNNGEVYTYIWASQTPGLTRINNMNAHRPFDVTAIPIQPSDFDGDNTVGSPDNAVVKTYQFDGALLDEGYWFFYMTTSATGEWALAFSDSVDVRHWPYFNLATPDAGGGYDYDADNAYTPAGGLVDDAPVWLESGGTIGKDGILVSGNNFGTLEIFWDLQDLDDNATLQIFRSSYNDLEDPDSVIVSGTAPNEVVTGIGTGGNAGVEITSSLIYEEGATMSYIYDIYTDASTYEPAGTFYIYLVGNDSTNQNVYRLNLNAGTAAANAKQVTIQHYPYFAYDDVYLIDPYPLDTAIEEKLVISWGGPSGQSGVIGRDNDADGDATINFYLGAEISYANGLNSILVTGGATVINAVGMTDFTNAVATGNVVLLGSTTENLNEKYQNRFEYDLKNSSFAAADYFIVAHLVEGSDNLLVQYDDDGSVANGFGPQTPAAAVPDRTIGLVHNAYEGGTYMPVSGETITLNGEDEFQFTWNFYDADDVTSNFVHIFMAPTGTDVAAIAAGNTWTLVDGVNPADWYWITSATGQSSVGAAAGPSPASSLYTLDVSDITTDMAGTGDTPDGFYDVYYFVSWDGGMDGETFIQAGGVMRFSGSTATLNDFRLTPNKAVVSKNDTLSITVYAYQPIAKDVELLTLELNVPDTYFTVIDQGSGKPFVNEAVNLNGTELENSMVQAGGYWQLSFAEEDNAGGSQLNTAGGEAILTFDVAVTAAASGTEYIEELIAFVNSGTRLTVIVDEFGATEASTIADPAARLNVAPPGWLEGQVDLELLADDGKIVDFHVLPRGSYTPITDADFLANNGGANADGSVSITLGTDGAYTLSPIPTGEYDVLVHYDNFLDQMNNADVQIRAATPTPLDFTGGDFLYAGDIAGYDDDGDVLTLEVGDNQIGTEDITYVSTAFGSIDGMANWNINADLDQSGKVYIVDYNTIIINYGAAGRNGDGLLYKELDPAAVNGEPVARLIAVSENGPEITYALEVSGLSSLNAYALEMLVNEDWEVVGFSDGLATYGASVPLKRRSGHNLTLVSALKGRGNALRNESMELLTVTLNAKVSNPEPVSVLEVSVVDGNNSMVKALVQGDVVPTEFALEQNYPNPFNPNTTISFSLPDAGDMKLVVYNLLGQEVRILVSGIMEPGLYKAIWSGADNSGRKVSSGMYFYRLTVGNQVIATKKMVMLK